MSGERCPSCRHEWSVLACEQCGDRWERPDDVPGSVVLTAEQVAQVWGLLDVICRDSLEAPFADVVAFERRAVDGESRAISGAFREIADLLGPKP